MKHGNIIKPPSHKNPFARKIENNLVQNNDNINDFNNTPPKKNILPPPTKNNIPPPSKNNLPPVNKISLPSITKPMTENKSTNINNSEAKSNTDSNFGIENISTKLYDKLKSSDYLTFTSLK